MSKSLKSGDDHAQLVARNKELKARLRKLEVQLQIAKKSKVVPLSQLNLKSKGSEKIETPSISSASSLSPVQQKVNSINSFWWPSPEINGGLLGKIYHAQHPPDCASPSTKFLVWQSRPESENDTRGLTAWAHAGSSNLLHAFTDADKVNSKNMDSKISSRVLVQDDKLWPMAKGCINGPQTRECYFEPLTSCQMTHVDEKHSGNSTELRDNKDEYDRNLRTVYTSAKKRWFRLINDKYSWTGLPGSEKDHSTISMTAALLAYYFRPKPWLRDEIGKRITRSIPADLNPERTVGVPIRRSDKCFGHNVTGSALGELDCPPLEMYLDGIRQFMQFDPNIENVIVTSEDKSACEEFVEILQKELPQLRVVLNVGDVQQGTGSGSKLESYVEGAANANVVSSALTSMHLHLRARYFVITSKSTWTSTIPVMARVYGFASEIAVLDIGRNTNAFSAYARSGCNGIKQKE